MRFSYFDEVGVTQKKVEAKVKKLARYRTQVAKVFDEHDVSKPEYSLVHVATPALHDTLDTLKKKFKGIDHLIVVGIGGPGLAALSVHEVLDEGKVQLHTLDTIAPYQIKRLLAKLSQVRSVKKVAVCIISKSGGTAETLVNASVLLDALEGKFKKAIYKQTIFIGNPKTHLMKEGKKLGVTMVPMPEVVGGRYSVATEVGLVPLALLGHDVDAFMGGVLDSSTPMFEEVVAEHAARVHHYLEAGYRNYNFFAFEPRLAMLGAWYRQLQAESLGKSTGKGKTPPKHGFVPSISTAVELHSVGQLYLSGFEGVYTDFVAFDDDSCDYDIPKKGLAKPYAKHTAQAVATGIYGGVMQAYQEKNLPYRSTIFDDGNLAYSLGLFMGMRMLETMYTAKLMGIDAFNQPNVELYKDKTRVILGV